MPYADSDKNLALETGGSLTTVVSLLTSLLEAHKELLDHQRDLRIELRLHSMLLAQGLNVRDDLDGLRIDLALIGVNPNAY